MGLQGDSDQEIKLKHLYHYEYQQLSLSVLLFSLPLLKQFVTISCFIKNARAYCQYCIFWGGSRWVGGCPGSLIDPPKLKHLASKAGLEVFLPAPIWVCIHRWTLLKPGNIATFYKTLRKQCMKSEDFWNWSSCIFKRFLSFIFILFSWQLEFYITLATVV